MVSYEIGINKEISTIIFEQHSRPELRDLVQEKVT